MADATGSGAQQGERLVFSGQSATGQARQHVGNNINNYTYTYQLRKRRSDESLREADRSRVLLKAAAEGQAPRVRHLLHLGADIDHTDDDGFGALHHAVLSGFEDIVQLLLDAGADVNADSLHFGSPLCLASMKGRESIITLLLQYRANVQFSGQACGTPLHCAVYASGIPNIASILLKHGASLEIVSEIHYDIMREFASGSAAVQTSTSGKAIPSTLRCRPRVLAGVENRYDLTEIFDTWLVGSATGLNSQSEVQAIEQEVEPGSPSSSESQSEMSEKGQDEVELYLSPDVTMNDSTSGRPVEAQTLATALIHQRRDSPDLGQEEEDPLERSQSIPRQDLTGDQDDRVNVVDAPDSHDDLETSHPPSAQDNPPADVSPVELETSAIHDEPFVVEKRASYVITTICNMVNAKRKPAKKHSTLPPCVYVICGPVPDIVGIYLQSEGHRIPTFWLTHTCGKEREAMKISSMTVGNYTRSRLRHLELILRAELGPHRVSFRLPCSCERAAGDELTKPVAWFRLDAKVAWDVVYFWRTVLAKLDRSIDSASMLKRTENAKENGLDTISDPSQRLQLWKEVLRVKVDSLEKNIQQHPHTMLGVHKSHLA